MAICKLKEPVKPLTLITEYARKVVDKSKNWEATKKKYELFKLQIVRGKEEGPELKQFDTKGFIGNPLRKNIGLSHF